MQLFREGWLKQTNKQKNKIGICIFIELEFPEFFKNCPGRILGLSVHKHTLIGTDISLTWSRVYFQRFMAFSSLCFLLLMSKKVEDVAMISGSDSLIAHQAL